MNELEKGQLNIFERNAKFVVIFAITCGSASGIFGKLITASSMTIGFYRLSFALPFFAIPVLLKFRESFRDVTKSDIAFCAVGGLFLFAHFFTWFRAVQTTTIASAIVIQAVYPLIVLLITIFVFKQHVHFKAILGIIIALVGGAIIAGFDFTFAGDSFSGDIYAFLSGAFYALYLCVGNVVRKKIPAGTYIFMVFFFAWVYFAIGMLLTSTPFVGYPKIDYIWMLSMAMVCQIGAHAVFNWCLGFVSSLYISACGTAEIVISSALAVIIFSEIPTLWQYIGAVFVILGLLYYNFNDSKKPS